MKRNFLIIGFFLLSLNSFSQKITFISSCTGNKVKVDYNIEKNNSFKILDYVFKKNDFLFQQTISISIEDKIDTVYIPKILFSVYGSMHNQKWIYQKCDKICSGVEKDYYKNGKLCLEGVFKEGKPEYIKYYNKKGVLIRQEIFENYTLNYKRVNYYDELGNLLEYEVYNNRRRKTIIKFYNKDGKFIKREIEKKILLKR